jgi:predicted NBD/HSP70 family sugar kinase
VDVGGTLTKFCFYEFDRERPEQPGFRPLGDEYRIQTPGKTGDGDDLNAGISQEEFAGQMLAAIGRFAVTHPEVREKLRNCTNCMAGISWPGPVRDNYPAGTSGVVGRFKGYKSTIDANSIDRIMRLNVVDAIETAWREKASEKLLAPARPFLALVNDGVADGIGAVAELGRKSQLDLAGNLAIVKLGTGLAGAVFSGGRLVDGVFEWGKVLLDLGGPPNRAWPTGTSNALLSSRTLPNLFKKYMAQLPPEDRSHVDDLDSREVGLLLTLPDEDGAIDPGHLRGLLEPYGLRGFENKYGIDAEIVRRVHSLRDQAEPELRQLVEGQVLANGKEAFAKLDQHLRVLGNIRLQQLLGTVTGDELTDALEGTINEKVENAIRRVRRAADTAITTMGHYLGDFLVLLIDMLQVRTFVLGGGVLTGETGKRLRQGAKTRAERYGVHLSGHGLIMRLAETADDTERVNENQEIHNSGTLGAAAHAASEYLFERKLQGIAVLERLLMRLCPNDIVVLDDQEMEFAYSTEMPERVCLGKYALSGQELLAFMEDYGPRHALYQCGSRQFRRWARE